jgi:hypothetical protein
VAKTEKQLKDQGFMVKNNCIYLENILPGSKDTLTVFISGGSTSDLGLDPNSWPKEILQPRNNNAKLIDMFFIFLITNRN